jgi:hypothetical protein
LNYKGITDEALQREYDRVANAEAVAAAFKEEGREEGRKEGEAIGLQKGQLKSLMQVFISSGQFLDCLSVGLDRHSEDSVKQLWNELSEAKTAKQYESFLQILQKKG